MPSAVSRLRSQLLQNGAVVDEMMPTVVPSGSAKRSAGAELGLDDGRDGTVVRGEAREDLLPRDHASPATISWRRRRPCTR